VVKRSGAEIIAIDLDDGKLKVARESGAAHTINARDPEIGRKILVIARVGVSAACDFVGADSTLALAWPARGRPSRGSGGNRRRHSTRYGAQDSQAGSIGVSIVVGQHP